MPLSPYLAFSGNCADAIAYYQQALGAELRYKISFGEMRASAGRGLSWISPLGPLRIAYAQPVRKQAGDKIQKLQFQIGTSF